MHIRLPTVAVLVVSILQPATARAQEGPQRPQVEVEQRGTTTNLTIGGSGWGGVIKDIQALRALPADDDAEVVDKLQRDIDTNPPAYIYELSRRVCAKDPQRAAYLFAVAGLRMRYDAYRCVDETALGGVTMTLMSLPMRECDALADNAVVMSAFRRAHDSKDLFSSKASPWWICSHGMAAMRAATEKKTLQPGDWLKPESDWPAIRQKLLTDLDRSLNEP